MKLLALILLALTLTLPKAIASQVENQEKVEQKEVRLDQDQQFILTFGPFDVEYFADRMLIKAKRVGLEHLYSKREFKSKTGRQLYRADIGPFASKEEAIKGWKKLKAIVRDLPDPSFK